MYLRKTVTARPSTRRIWASPRLPGLPTTVAFISLASLIPVSNSMTTLVLPNGISTLSSTLHLRAKSTCSPGFIAPSITAILVE
ncbi:putative aromatic hydrocarbon dioxygenase large [Pseudomonas putida DOT-T1E]|uniref:Aromatic hydrocarbon dioxygenase large n=1 Tax=Pseudomonas putida (strain DOT-T1E) TaxID=1196325 RepID=I7AXX3_PSEPT|nr:putative aromatic hydrocarbon dioxygenase large [Pseudomonas putida DOT-T1E]